jgi:hypothetical protein
VGGWDLKGEGPGKQGKKNTLARQKRMCKSHNSRKTLVFLKYQKKAKCWRTIREMVTAKEEKMSTKATWRRPHSQGKDWASLQARHEVPPSPLHF